MAWSAHVPGWHRNRYEPAQTMLLIICSFQASWILLAKSYLISAVNLWLLRMPGHVLLVGNAPSQTCLRSGGEGDVGGSHRRIPPDLSVVC